MEKKEEIDYLMHEQLNHAAIESLLGNYTIERMEAFAKEQSAHRLFKWYYRRRIDRLAKMEITLLNALINVRHKIELLNK